jgi:hypothetical protein
MSDLMFSSRFGLTSPRAWVKAAQARTEPLVPSPAPGIEIDAQLLLNKPERRPRVAQCGSCKLCLAIAPDLAERLGLKAANTSSSAIGVLIILFISGYSLLDPDGLGKSWVVKPVNSGERST